MDFTLEYNIQSEKFYLVVVLLIKHFCLKVIYAHKYKINKAPRYHLISQQHQSN